MNYIFYKKSKQLYNEIFENSIKIFIDDLNTKL